MDDFSGRIDRLDSELKEVMVRLRVIEQNQAKSEENHKHIDRNFVLIEKRFDDLSRSLNDFKESIDKTASKIIWYIITGVGVPVIIWLVANSKLLGAP